jgi:heat shock protein HslJ
MHSTSERLLWPNIVLFSAWLAACSGSPPKTPGRAPSDGGLAGTTWRLVEFRGGDESRLTPDDRNKYTIDFQPDGSLLLRIDCNRGRGTWKASGPQLELGPLAVTRMACPPGSLHDQIVGQWANVRSYVIKDGHLFLALMADGGIYEFEPASGGETAVEGRPAKPTATLENTYWRLTAVGGDSARVAQNIQEPHFILHPADTRVSGSTGCNQFSGSYELSGQSLRFGKVISTLRACLDPELNRQERTFLDAVNAARQWKVTGDSLELSGEAGPLVSFHAQYLK